MILSKWVGFLKSVMRMFIVSRWLTQKTDPEIHHLEKKGVAAAECLWWWLAFEDRIETAIGMIMEWLGKALIDSELPLVASSFWRLPLSFLKRYRG